MFPVPALPCPALFSLQGSFLVIFIFIINKISSPAPLSPRLIPSPDRSSLRFWGWCLATRTISSHHRIVMVLWSGDWLGHSRSLVCFFLSHCLNDKNAFMLEWQKHMAKATKQWLKNHIKVLAGFNALALTVHGPVHHPFDAVQFRDGSRFSNIRIFYLIIEYRLGCAIIF